MINYKKLFSIVSKSIVVFSIVFCSCKINVTPKPAENPLPSNYIYVKDFSTYIENSEETEVSVHILDKDPDLSIIRKGLDSNKNKMLSIDLSECTDLFIVEMGTFKNCTNLISIILPDSLLQIYPYAFKFCSELKNIYFGENLTIISEEAFDGCSKIEKLEFFKNLQYVGKLAFPLKMIAEIIISEENPTFGEYAKYHALINSTTGELVLGCNKTVIPEGVKKILYASMWSYNSTSLEIPSSVTEIMPGAFYCPHLISITVHNNNKVYDSRNNCNAIIKTDENRFIYGCKTTKIPDTVTIIGNPDYPVFNKDCVPENLIIPESVHTIEKMAFCTLDLYEIIVPSTVTTIGNNAFGGTYIVIYNGPAEGSPWGAKEHRKE